MMTCGTLFSGVDLIALGLEWAGMRLRFQVETNESCQRLNEQNFPGAKRHSDVRTCGKHNLAKVDLIAFGSPCQAFSVAGRQKGFDDERGRLFDEAVRIIRELRPPWVLFENVPPTLNRKGDRILSALEEAGYKCWPMLLGAEEVGATHRRQRAWVLAARADAHGVVPRAEGGRRLAHRLPPAASRHFMSAIKQWNRRADRGGNRAGAGRLRGDDGRADWVDAHARLKALGNSVVPAIPMLFGCFIQEWERQRRKKR